MPVDELAGRAPNEYVLTMKTHITLHLLKNGKCRVAYEGTPLDFGAMLHFAAKSDPLKFAVLSAASAIVRDMTAAGKFDALAESDWLKEIALELYKDDKP